MILLLSQNSKSFSQIDSASNYVRLRPAIAVRAVQELIRYDELKIRVALMEDQIKNFTIIVSEKDKIIKDKEESEVMWKQIADNQDVIESNLRDQLKDMTKKYKKQVRLGRFKMVLLTGAIAFGIYKSLK